MSEKDESLIPIWEPRMSPRTGRECRRPGLALHVQCAGVRVRDAGFPAAACPGPVRGVVIPIQWPPKMSWSKEIRLIPLV